VSRSNGRYSGNQPTSKQRCCLNKAIVTTFPISFLDAMKAIGTMLVVIALSIVFALYLEWVAKGAADAPLPEGRLSDQA
jgi:hypothetical protein